MRPLACLVVLFSVLAVSIPAHADVLPRLDATNAIDARLLAALPLPQDAGDVALAFSPGGRWLAAYGAFGLQVVDLPTIAVAHAAPPATFAGGRVTHAHFLDDATLLIADWSQVHLADPATGVAVGAAYPSDVLLLPTVDGGLLRCCTDGATLLDARSGGVRAREPDARVAAVSVDGRWVAFGLGGAAYALEVRTGTRTAPVDVRGRWPTAAGGLPSGLSVSVDGGWAALVVTDDYTQVLVTVDGTHTAVVPLDLLAGQGVRALEGAGETRVAVPEGDSGVSVYALGAATARYRLPRSTCDLRATGGLVWLCNGGRGVAYDITDGAAAYALPVLPQGVAASPEATLIATLACADGQVGLWQAQTGGRLGTLPARCTRASSAPVLAWAPDGASLVVAAPPFLVVYGVPAPGRIPYASVPGVVVPSAINVRVAPRADAAVVGLARGAVVVGGRDSAGRYVYLVAEQGWALADPFYVQLPPGTPLEDLPVLDLGPP